MIRPLFALAGLVVILLLAAPVWMIAMAVFHFAVPWLFFAILLWLGFRLIGGPRHHRRRWERAYYGPPPRPAAPRSPERPPQPRPSAPPPRPRQPDPRRLPLDVQVKVEQIRRKVEVLLRHVERFPFASEQLYVVRATAKDYLPRTLDAYFALPPEARETARVADGKTALEELRQQLALLDSKLDEIAEDIERRNLDRLLANRVFLEARFGRSEPVSF
jgi:hypothetical protein